MPVTIQSATTPAGKAICRAQVSGLLGPAEAGQVVAALGPGGAFHGLPLLGVVAADTSFSTEARKAFAALGETSRSVSALVVGSAPARVMLNFVVKAARTLNPAAPETRFFPDEAQALAWLDTLTGA